MTAPRAAVVSVGDEVLRGDIVDSNAAYLARALRGGGLTVVSLRGVRDRVEDIAEALQDAAARAEVVVVTGGLGPTRDDLTRHGLARAMGEELIEDAAALADIQSFFRKLKRPMSESNRLQALRPASARSLANEVGTAPGVHGRLRDAEVFLMPGVPSEMKRMLDVGVLPALRERGLFAAPLPLVRVKAHGLPESVAGERIAEFMGETGDPLVGITVSGGILTVTMQARSAAGAERIEPIAAEIERRLEPHAFARGDASLQSALVELLKARGARMATAESCTGGLIAEMLTRVPGSSDVFERGFVTYSNAAKRELLGVDAAAIEAHGAVSEAVAIQMALGAQRNAGVDLAVSATGIAGPGGATADKPVGLVYCGIALRGLASARRYLFVGDRELVRMRTACCALDLARLALLGKLA